MGASGIDEIARSLLTDLVALPGSAGSGSRSPRAVADGCGSPRATGPTDGRVEWCHIDAYDDVPLTPVVAHRRAGARRPRLARPAVRRFVADQPAEVRAVAAVPLPGIGSPIGGLIVFLEEEWAFDERAAPAARGDRPPRRRRRTPGAGRQPRPATRTTPDADRRRHHWPPGSSSRTTPAPPGAARRFLRAFLDRVAEVTDDLTATAELCLSELVTNAIDPRRQPLGADASPSTTAPSPCRCATVAARCRARARCRRPTTRCACYGRGLQLVDALADRWGSDADAAASRRGSRWRSTSRRGRPARTG